MEPIKLEIFMKDLTRTGMQSVKGNLNDIKQNTLAVISLLEKELGDMQAKAKQAASQGMVDKKQMADIQAMTGMVKGLKDGLKDLEKQKQQTNEAPVVGNNASVGIDDVAKKTNNLKLQFSQVARELPSLAMGPQMFILAISNNLPMLADAIKDVRVQNELMKASGQKSVPVWKQLAGSLFSWQTALIAAISLGIVYGKDIWEWAKNLGKAKTEMTAAQKAMEGMNAASRKAIGSRADEIAKLRMLYTATQDATRSQTERNKAADALQKQYPKYFANLNNEAILAGKAATAYDNLTKALIRAGQAKAAEDIVADYTKQNYQLQRAINADTNYVNKNQKKYEEALELNAARRKKLRENTTESGSTIVRGIGNLVIDNTDDGQFVEEYERRQKETEKNLKKIADNNTAINNISKSIKVDDITFDEDNKKTKSSGGKSALDYQNELADARIRAQQKLEATRISVMEDGYKKRQALARREMDEAIALIDKEERDILLKMEEAKKKKGIKITPEEEKQVKDTANLIRAIATEKYIKDYYTIEKDWRNENLQAWVDYYKEYGTYQEKRIAIEKEYNNKIAEIYEQRRKAQENGDTEQAATLNLAISKATKDKGKDLMNLDYKELIQSPDYIRAFENLKQTSSDTLNSLLAQFESAKQAAAQVLSPDELREYTTTIQDIMDELDSRNPFQALADRKEELAEAEKELAEAKRNLDTVNSGGKVANGVKYNEKTGKMDTIYLSGAQALEKYNKAQDKVTKSGAKVDKAEKDVKDVVNELSAAFKELGSVVGGQAGEIISLIGDVGTFAMTAMNGVTTSSATASAAVKAVEKASVILAIISAAIQVATKIASLFTDDDGIAEYERAKEVYESYIDILDRIIEKQKELFELNSKTGEQAYEQAKETVKKQEDASRQLGKQYLDAGASKGFWGIGSKKSHGVDQREDISGNAWSEAQKALGSDFYTKGIGDGRMTGLFDLSVEQLKKLQSDAPLFWAELHSDTQKYLQQIIDCNDELTQLENDRMEGLVKTDFSSFSDSFLDVLTDLDTSSKDFADNFEEYLRNAILNSLITEKYKADIQNLYKQWATDTESGNKLTEDETEKLRKEQERIANALLAEREQLMKDFGWSSSSKETQSGRAGSITTITEQTGGEISGTLNVMLDYDIARNKLLEELKASRAEDSKVFADIAENTAYCKLLQPMLDVLERFEMNGMKMKG